MFTPSRTSSRSPDPQGIPPRAILPLSLGFALLLLPQLSRLPIWLSVVAAGACLWGVGQHQRWWRPVPRALRFIVMLALVATFAATHLGQFTVETAAAFFVVTVALKWTELEQPRDIYVMFMILCYLAAVTFLFKQGIFWTIAVILAVIILFGTLQTLSAGSAQGLKIRAWKRLGWTLLKVLPVVVVLFMIFPRLGPLWSVPLVSEQGSAGLSESMTPGDFASVARNSEPAFRVRFGGEAPPPSQRYWRGLILDRYDGRTWYRSGDASGASIGRVNQSGGAGDLEPSEYEILMEPTYQPWAFSLAGSVPATDNLELTEHGLVQFDRPVDTTVRYRMRQTGEDTRTSLDRESYARYTALPRGLNPKTRSWASDLAHQAGSPNDFISAVMTHFRESPFFYTLETPALGRHAVDEFLFQSREGFCAHYAGATTFALRSVGIPARVIGGYLGGEPGLNNEYLIIRQYDAHAWVEAWIEGDGWVRLDPTAMVAPQRVQQGWRQALRSGAGDAADDWASTGPMHWIPLLRWAGLRLDAADYYWQRFVVNYQGDTQRSLFGKLPGNPDLATLGYWTAGFLAVVVALAGAMMIRRERAVPEDPVIRYALRWQRWLVKRGVDTGAGQSPMQQAEQASRAFPQQRAAVMGFARALDAALYNPDPAAASRHLEQRWVHLRREFRPSLWRPAWRRS